MIVNTSFPLDLLFDIGGTVLTLDPDHGCRMTMEDDNAWPPAAVHWVPMMPPSAPVASHSESHPAVGFRFLDEFKEFHIVDAGGGGVF